MPMLARKSSSQMDALQPIPSVLSELMGIDNFQMDKPHTSKVRVLSDDYFQNVAFIGVWKKCAERFSSNTVSNTEKKMENVFYQLESLKGGRKFKSINFNRDKVPRYCETKILLVKDESVESRNASLADKHFSSNVWSKKIDSFKNVSCACGSFNSSYTNNVLSTTSGSSLCGKSFAQTRGKKFSAAVQTPFVKRSRFSKDITGQPEPFSDKRKILQSCDSSLQNSLMHNEFEMLENCDSYSEGSCILSDDENTVSSTGNDRVREKDKITDSEITDRLDFSYVADILIEAGYHRSKMVADPVSLDTGSSVFDTLEKKYGDQSQWNRLERKLLFDRVNSTLKEILQPSLGIPSWTQSVRARFRVKEGVNSIEDELWRTLTCLDVEATKITEKVLGKDDRWMNLEDEIQEIEMEIEQFLMEDLVEDFTGNVESYSR